MDLAQILAKIVYNKNGVEIGGITNRQFNLYFYQKS